MVLISEISKEGCTKLKQRDGVEDGGGGSDGGIVLDSQNAVAEVAELLVEGGSVPGENSLKEADMSAGKPPYNEYALRVAYIMRSYLHTRPGSGSADVAASGEVSAGGDRCRALMEVVKKETGRWFVSTVVLEHAHSLTPPPDPAGTVAGSRLVPAVGMEFDSISMAKAFYYTYSEKMGFKARTGSGRRSRGNPSLVMQRFLCSKGNCPLSGNSAGQSMVKRKRGPYRKITSNTGNDGNLDSAAEVFLGETCAEEAGVAGDEMRIEGQSGQPEKIETFQEKDGMTKPSVSDSDLGSNVAAVGMDGQKPPLGGIPAQSRLLRELGIRVSRYTHEERRDIILRYLRKRNNRQVVDRSVKVPSRQALAERRQRGFGGKFLSKEETQSQALTKPQETIDEDPEVPPEVVAKAGGVPMVGMGFESEDKAYEYYVTYAANIGFSVRKGLSDKSAKNVTRSRVYVCSRGGFRPKNAVSEAKKSRPETRTGCCARMAIKATSFGRYRVTEFVADHSHQLALPLNIQMLKSQKLLSNAQHKNQQNADLIPAHYKNYVRGKRIRSMKVGDAGTILEYLQKMKGCNPSFYYAIQVDEDDKMTNVFWADARSIMDYYYFGDVVCFHTPYRTNVCDRPLALFIGVNHHKQIVIFGSAFVYDETVETFKWLFETFQTAVAGKQPKTIFLDQCREIDDAIAAIWPGTSQRLCPWQLYQHAFKHLGEFFQTSESFVHDFCRCIFDFEEEEEFMASWSIMLEKYNLKENEWLKKIYEKKEKWAPAYSRDTFCADLQTTLRSECFNDILKEWLNQEADLSYFFRQYEKLLEEKRYAELQADYHANQGIPRIPHLRMLWQAANMYTPAMFEIFRSEFELFMNCVVCSCGEIGTFSEYEVTLKGKTRAHFVRFDSLDGTVICSCKKFFFVGIQCCHVLKVLDFRDIKELPQQFILKRWRKDAKSGSLRDNQGLVLEEDPNSTMTKRYNSLCRILYRIAERAAENMDTFTVMAGQSDQLIEQVERILQTKLLEKPPLNNALKVQAQNPAEIQISLDDNSEALKVNCKKRKEAVVRRRQQAGLQVNKRHKLNKGQAEECNDAARDLEPPLSTTDVIPQISSSNQFIAQSHFMQGPYVTSHHFGLATAQGFHAMTQFGQDSASVLQQTLI
ncbi:protein FAR1-RELATED SEQUENCE 5 [Dendrobium catenatum]|uniref:protein FAR1-RELATED SEQUENCE 5 n=1 Tax=Dendrobium catenatum TaxID=906689 RepID=UPI0010A06213|nr:protein FAR1-RELATED SEQUENCE 5 [Dendrobium catenatum]